MRKVVYSVFFKLTAILLLMACIVTGALTVTSAVIDYCAEEEDVYSFESDFSQSWYLPALLREPESAIAQVYHNTFSAYATEGQEGLPDDDAKLESGMQSALANLYCADKIRYYVEWNDAVFTNCEAKSEKELMQSEYYLLLSRDGEGNIIHKSSLAEAVTHSYLMEEMALYDRTDHFTVCCSIEEQTVNEIRAIWERQERTVTNAFILTLACAMLALLLFIYLLCVCGKNKDGAYKGMWLDNVWLEVHLAVIGEFGIGAAVLLVVVLDAYISGRFPIKLIYPTVGSIAAVGSLVLISCLLSIVRNIKMGRLMQRSVTLRIARWLWYLLQRIGKWFGRKTAGFFRTVVRALSKKTGVILTVMLLLYTALTGFLGACVVISPLSLILGVLLFALACFAVAYRASELEEIKKGADKVRGGDFSYQIPTLHCDDLKVLADNVNGIAVGLDESLAARVKAERMKTELITNVSHDLKTPITSIINYTELLSQMEDLPPQARDYMLVISQKGQRLKRLTQDLFDISKVQSGNERVTLERLNVALLIGQALGELDKEIQASGLQLCVQTPKELSISADGGKMSRVLGNLIGNILKYAMKNTRVFITACEKNGGVEIEFKNISAYPLDFDTEEITARFVRADASRTTEGNGLGLAIAKSYTELCGGELKILVDGDLFKAILKFKGCDQPSS